MCIFGYIGLLSGRRDWQLLPAILKLFVHCCRKVGSQSEQFICHLLLVRIIRLWYHHVSIWYLTILAHCRGRDWWTARHEAFGEYERVQRFECWLCIRWGYCKYSSHGSTDIMPSSNRAIFTGKRKRYSSSVLRWACTLVGQSCVDWTNWPWITVTHQRQCNNKAGKIWRERSTMASFHWYLS